MFVVKSNQYIPYKAKSLPSGMPACETYYYVTNEKGQIMSKKTLKPYRGKEMNNYFFPLKELAEKFVTQLESFYLTNNIK